MITVNSYPERREAVTAINDFDTRTGGLKSQKAKYEKPLWFYILALLPGQDQSFGMGVDDIQKELKKHNLHFTVVAIHRALQVMMNLDESIKPHRRNCGISCYEATEKLGGVKRCVSFSSRPVPGARPMVYYLGKSISLIHYHRKAWNIYVNPPTFATELQSKENVVITTERQTTYTFSFHTSNSNNGNGQKESRWFTE